MNRNSFALLMAGVVLFGIAATQALASGELLLVDTFEFTGSDTMNLQQDQRTRQTGTLAPGAEGSLLPTAWGSPAGWAQLSDVAGFGRAIQTNSWLAVPVYNAYNFNSYDHLVISADIKLPDDTEQLLWGRFFVGAPGTDYTEADQFAVGFREDGAIGLSDATVSTGHGTSFTPGTPFSIEMEIVKGAVNTTVSVSIDGAPLVLDYVINAPLTDKYIGFGAHYFDVSMDNFSVTAITDTAPLLAGDANRDGFVSGGDYASVQSHFNETGVLGILGDADGNGMVSASDYASVQSNFGSVGMTTVPEPASMCLLSLGLAVMVRRRK